MRGLDGAGRLMRRVGGAIAAAVQRTKAAGRAMYLVKKMQLKGVSAAGVEADVGLRLLRKLEGGSCRLRQDEG